MKLSRVMLAAACVAMLTTTGHAQQPDSANYVMRGCRPAVERNNHSEILLQGMCMGAVKAIAELDAGVCSPRGSTSGQAIRVVIAYIDARPARAA